VLSITHKLSANETGISFALLSNTYVLQSHKYNCRAIPTVVLSSSSSSMVASVVAALRLCLVPTPPTAPVQHQVGGRHLMPDQLPQQDSHLGQGQRNQFLFPEWFGFLFLGGSARIACDRVTVR
jgi:hypothetical protein